MNSIALSKVECDEIFQTCSHSQQTQIWDSKQKWSKLKCQHFKDSMHFKTTVIPKKKKVLKFLLCPKPCPTWQKIKCYATSLFKRRKLVIYPLCQTRFAGISVLTLNTINGLSSYNFQDIFHIAHFVSLTLQSHQHTLALWSFIPPSWPPHVEVGETSRTSC